MTSVVLYNNLPILLYVLSNNFFINNTNINTNDYWLKEKIIVHERKYPTYNYTKLRLWKSVALNSYYFQDMNNDNYLGGLDYVVNNDNIKIEYHTTNDKEHYNICNNTYKICKQDHYVNEEDSKKIKEALLYYVINIAKYYNITKIYKDVHCNLKVYKKDYEPYGFKLTKRRCDDNPYWIITKKNI